MRLVLRAGAVAIGSGFAGLLLFVSAAYAAPIPGCEAAATGAGATTTVSTLDSDSDGLSDHVERCVYGTDPAKADTDGDGHADGTEVAGGFSPRAAGKKMTEVDSDKDYLNDAWEILLGTGIDNPDTDGDLYLDGTEVAASFNPLATANERIVKRIEVDRAGLHLAYYFGDKKLDEIPVSTGKPSTPTPLGDFSVLGKYPVKHYRGTNYDYPNTKWNLKFTSWNGLGYYIHGAYWHQKFGKAPVSGGCVNVRYEDMERLYWFAQNGTSVTVK